MFTRKGLIANSTRSGLFGVLAALLALVLSACGGGGSGGSGSGGTGGMNGDTRDGNLSVGVCPAVRHRACASMPGDAKSVG